MAGGGERNSSGRAHSYFSDVRVDEKEYVSGLRAERPIEIRVAMAEAVKAGIVFSGRLLTAFSQVMSSRHNTSSLWTTRQRR